ncbi:hypothetical protein, partial [Stenotrophomonas sp. GbtcB23]|uniref:hypothetical protein n=1 Tax=Stenotrophomonas sp. GbtcB23 TaxID=2824768 RepID=UPI001C30CF76
MSTHFPDCLRSLNGTSFPSRSIRSQTSRPCELSDFPSNTRTETFATLFGAGEIGNANNRIVPVTRAQAIAITRMRVDKAHA